MEGVEDIPGTALHEGLSWEWESFGDFLDVARPRPPRRRRRRAAPPRRAAPLRDGRARRGAGTGHRGGDRRDGPARRRGGRRRRARLHHLADPEPPDEPGRLDPDAHRRGRRARRHRRRARPGRARACSRSCPTSPTRATSWARCSAWPRPPVDRCRSRSPRCPPVRARGATCSPPSPTPTSAAWSSPHRSRPGRSASSSASRPPSARSAARRPLGHIGFDPETLAKDDVRATILAEVAEHGPTFPWTHVYRLDDPPDYEPPPEASIAAEAARLGIAPEALAYDLVMADGGHGLLYVPFLNYADGDLEPTREMLTHPHAVLGLADGGAHVGTICDASFPTTMLTHWVRDRSRGAAPPPRPRRRHADRPHRPHGRAPRPGRRRPGHAGRPQRDRPRRLCACSRRPSPSTCRPAASGSCSGPTATCTPSSPARRPTRPAKPPAPSPDGWSGAASLLHGDRPRRDLGEAGSGIVGARLVARRSGAGTDPARPLRGVPRSRDEGRARPVRRTALPHGDAVGARQVLPAPRPGGRRLPGPPAATRAGPLAGGAPAPGAAA